MADVQKIIAACTEFATKQAGFVSNSDHNLSSSDGDGTASYDLYLNAKAVLLNQCLTANDGEHADSNYTIPKLAKQGLIDKKYSGKQ